MSTAKTRTIVNSGTRRVVIGRGPKSKRSTADSRVLKFDTNADADIPADLRIGSSHEISLAEAKRLEESPVFKSTADMLGLSVSAA